MTKYDLFSWNIPRCRSNAVDRKWIKDFSRAFDACLPHQDALTRMSQDEQVENLMSKIPQGQIGKF
jgi:hypothetical protein